MKIALVGATGKIGRQIAATAVTRGHALTAIVRKDTDLPAELAGAQVRAVSLADATALAAAARGHDVLASAFGPGAGDPSAVVEVTRQLIAAARAGGVRRLVVVGGAGNLELPSGGKLMDAPAFPAAYKPYALVHGEALALLRAADDLDWTFYAPAAEIGPGERRGGFRTGARALITAADGHSRISYPDYADAFVAEIETPRFVKQVATVAY